VPAEEFLKASDDELLTRADECLKRSGTALDVAPMYLDDAVKLRLFFEAHSCISEVVRRQAERTAERDRERNEQIALRDFWMEVVVILLIGLEIVVGIYEGRRQGAVLDQQVAVLRNMETSTANTAKALQQATISLANLAKAQDESLRIFQEEEADRAKKPKLTLYIGHIPLAPGRENTIKPRQQSDSTATFDMVLRNVGEANANRITWRVLVPLDVAVNSTPTPIPGYDLPDRPVHAFLYFLDLLTPKGYSAASITFFFAKAHAPFQVSFNESSAEMAGETPLGSLKVVPQNASK
jgi:hypothetical protein